ncbi:MAG: GGDEF domain-containing protein [Pseudolabrys sp.]|nr:GGDEF domain-containing protein [Pseudolabrys sp.]
MLVAAAAQQGLLDIPTLVFAAVCIVGFLGLLLITTWLRQRDVRALAWWGSAYLIGAAAVALWGAPDPHVKLPPEVPEALIFIACGMVWNGVRLFHGRRLWPLAAFAGAIGWLILCQIPGLEADSQARIGAGAIVVAIYTFFIAYEMSRERRKSLYSKTAAILVPCLYAGTFLLPLGMRAFLPGTYAAHWLTAFALESMIYAVGTAFIVLLMVKDHHVHFYRKAATTDGLTGLLNRRAFLEAAAKMQAAQGGRGEPVTLLMFDLDKFKSINDRFGHATGDSVLKVFAQTMLSSTRASDIVARLGGEEFVAMVPETKEDACHVAERLRANFEAAGVTVDDIAIGATVSSGLATSYRAVADIDALLQRADEALYRAKHEGRNRFRCADEEPGSEQVRALAAAARQKAAGGLVRRWVARRPKATAAVATV